MPSCMTNCICSNYETVHFVLLIRRRVSGDESHSTRILRPIQGRLFASSLFNGECNTCVCHPRVRTSSCGVCLSWCLHMDELMCRKWANKKIVTCVRVCLYWVFSTAGIYYLSNASMIRKHCHLVVWGGAETHAHEHVRSLKQTHNNAHMQTGARDETRSEMPSCDK